MHLLPFEGAEGPFLILRRAFGLGSYKLRLDLLLNVAFPEFRFVSARVQRGKKRTNAARLRCSSFGLVQFLGAKTSFRGELTGDVSCFLGIRRISRKTVEYFFEHVP